MKIAMFTDTYYPMVDGAVVSVTTTSQELMKRGHEVVIFAPKPIDGPLNGLKERIVWLPSRGFGKYRGYRIAIYPSNISSQVRKENPDIIHSHGISFAGLQALLASRQTKIKNVLTYHTMVTEAAIFYSPPIMPVDVILKLAWIYQRNYLRRPHAVIAPTKAIKEELLKNGIVARRWEIIPTGIDCARFSSVCDGNTVRQKYGLDGKKLILTVGRLSKEKNMELIINGFVELLKRRDDVRLMIVGTGPAEQDYRSFTSSLGIADNVIFTGFVPDSQLPSYYDACDAFAIASRFETQGLVVLEAMACGKPVAGLNYRAIPEIIQDGKNGYLFEENYQSFSDTLDRAVDDSDRVSAEAKKTAQRYSVENCTGRLIQLYREISGKD